MVKEWVSSWNNNVHYGPGRRRWNLDSQDEPTTSDCRSKTETRRGLGRSGSVGILILCPELKRDVPFCVSVLVSTCLGSGVVTTPRRRNHVGPRRSGVDRSNKFGETQPIDSERWVP